ncbi:hypothetical protein MRX96_002840 [Rhipicephalus microplus]
MQKSEKGSGDLIPRSAVESLPCLVTTCSVCDGVASHRRPQRLGVVGALYWKPVKRRGSRVPCCDDKDSAVFFVERVSQVAGLAYIRLARLCTLRECVPTAAAALRIDTGGDALRQSTLLRSPGMRHCEKAGRRACIGTYSGPACECSAYQESQMDDIEIARCAHDLCAAAETSS